MFDRRHEFLRFFELASEQRALMLLSGVLAFGTQRAMPEPELRALAFVSLTLVKVGLILVNRSFSASLLTALRRGNRALGVLVAGVSIALVIARHWSPARELFRFGPLHLDDLVVWATAGGGVLGLLEVLKPRWHEGFRS